MGVAISQDSERLYLAVYKTTYSDDEEAQSVSTSQLMVVKADSLELIKTFPDFGAEFELSRPIHLSSCEKYIYYALEQ